MKTAVNETRDKWFDYVIVYMKSVAVHPLDFNFLPSNLKFLKYILNFFYFGFWHFIVIHLAIVLDFTIYVNFDQTIDEIIGYIMNGSIYTFAYFIIVYMEINLRKSLKLFEFIKENFRERSARGLTYVTIDESKDRGKKYCCWWINACLAGTLSWLLYPLVKCCNILPLNSWYPIDVSSFPNYQIAYFFQMFGQFFIGIIYGIVGGMHIAIIVMICGQFDILYASLKNIGKAVSKDDSAKLKEFREKQKNFNLNDEEVNQYFISTEKFDEPVDDKDFPSIADTVKDCVEHHQMLSQFMVLCEGYFSWLILPTILYSAYLICMIAFVFSTQEEFQLMKVASLLIYLALSSSEMLLFNLNAELVKQHSIRAGDALMRSNWDDYDSKTRKSILIILANAAKPAQFTAGKILNLSIDQFRAAMGTAFSYYTLLTKLREKSQVA